MIIIIIIIVITINSDHDGDYDLNRRSVTVQKVINNMNWISTA